MNKAPLAVKFSGSYLYAILVATTARCDGTNLYC